MKVTFLSRLILTLSVFFLVIITLYTSPANAKVSRFFFEKSELSKSWYYIDQFCFDNEGEKAMGSVSYKANNLKPELLTNLTVALFRDDYFEKLERDLAKSNYQLPCSQVISRNYTPYIVNMEQHTHFRWDINQESRPRFWYVFLGACDRNGKDFKAGKKEYFEIDFTWLNPGNIFERQFSKDRHGIYATLLAFTPLLTLMCIAYTFSVVMLIRSNCFHWIVRVFYGSLLLYTASSYLALFHNMVYASNGIGVPFFDGMSTALRLCAELSFMMLLYLIASGWTVTQPYLRHAKYLAGILLALIILYSTMFSWSQISLATQINTSDYVYETVPGVLLAALRIPALAFFIYALKTTYKKEVSAVKIWFYRTFALYSVWFLILPVMVLTALLIPRQHRAKWVEGLTRSIELVTYVSMMILLWYSRARQYFSLSEDESKQGMYENL